MCEYCQPEFSGFSADGTGGDAAASFASLSTLATFLTNGYWTSTGRAAHRWASNTISVNLTDLTTAERDVARAALQSWSDVANLTFIETTGAANINFRNDGSGQAFANYTANGAFMTGANVNISSDWSGGANGINNYMFQTYIHEIGHALGLGHQGPYNGSASYGTHNIYTNDTWQYSVMSYFGQHNFGGSSYNFLLTPAMADILAIQSLYGASGARSGNTTYGFNSNAGQLYNFSTNGSFTIHDAGGTDTLDASNYGANQTINLNPGTWSSIGGKVNNIGIYTTAWIENAVGGFGNDTIYGNAIGNNLQGRGGSDSLYGGAGFDTLDGGTGADFMAGGADGDVYYVDSGSDAIYEAAGEGFDIVYASTSYALSNNVDYLLLLEAAGSASAFGNATGATLAGNSFANYLQGGSARDFLYGQGGSDSLKGGLGQDHMDGGSGVDTADYSDKSASVVVALNGASNATVFVGGVAEDTVVNVENLIGGSGHDSLTGDGFSNTFIGGLGDDVIDGGGAMDFVDYSSDTLGVKVRLAANSGKGAGIGEDTLFNIEGVLGGFGNDTISGSIFDDYLSGGAGKDKLAGGPDSDTLVGGTGKDLLTGGSGIDFLYGDGGKDGFVFKGGLGAANFDTIFDFVSGVDKLHLDKSFFKNAGATGKLAGAKLVYGTNAKDAADRVIYDQLSGNVFFDKDGKGGASKVLFANLDNLADLKASDILLIA